jgi:hypothetical protein
MVRTTRRPIGVTFAVCWGIVLAGILAARAMGHEAAPPVLPEGLLTDAALTAVQGVLAFALATASVCVYKLASWARRLGMLVFLLAAGGTALTLLSGSLFGFVVVALDLTAILLLFMHGDAFRSERPDIDDTGSATHFGAP